MGKKSPVNKPPRVVLDTNCLISALLFSNGKLSWLRDAWQSGRFTPLVSRDTVEELIQVFAYPKFKLNKNEQEILLADFLPYAETVQIAETTGASGPGRCYVSKACSYSKSRSRSTD